MKQLNFFQMALIIVIVAILGAGVEDMFDKRNNLKPSYSYEKIDKIFNALPSRQGFQSPEYKVGNYDGTVKKDIPLSEVGLFIFRDTPQEYEKEGMKNREILEKNHKGVDIFNFITQDSFKLTTFYYRDKPFMREDLTPCNLGGGQDNLSSVDINGNSFLIKTQGYDFHAKRAAVYMNGTIIFNYLPVDGDIPLQVFELKAWDKKVIFRLSQMLGFSKVAYAIFDPSTKEFSFSDIKQLKDEQAEK
jgi:hypothetical protein